jgi:hypothetical protein
MLKGSIDCSSEDGQDSAKHGGIHKILSYSDQIHFSKPQWVRLKVLPKSKWSLSMGFHHKILVFPYRSHPHIGIQKVAWKSSSYSATSRNFKVVVQWPRNLEHFTRIQRTHWNALRYRGFAKPSALPHPISYNDNEEEKQNMCLPHLWTNQSVIVSAFLF